jgi:hypothetical protein
MAKPLKNKPRPIISNHMFMWCISFPHCRLGEECLYVHETCKFGEK